MNEPPNGQYTRPYVPGEDARTVDGKQIVPGLRVFTNNLDRGPIDLDRAHWEWHGPENVYHLWFDVNPDIDYKGQPYQGRGHSQSDDRVVTRFKGRLA